VGAIRTTRSGAIRRIRDAAHSFWNERGIQLGTIFRFAAVGIAALLAFVSLLAVLGEAKVPWVAGRATNDEAAANDAPMPTLAPRPELRLNANDATTSRVDRDGGASPLSAVFPVVGELLNFGGDGTSANSDTRPFSGPRSEPPSGDGGTTTPPEPSPTASDDPSPTGSDVPSPTAEPEPSSEPSAEPSNEPQPPPSPSNEPSPEPEPTSEPSPEPTEEPEPSKSPKPSKTPEPTSEPSPEPTEESESLTTLLGALARII
jgi:hypothetical protein